MENPLVLKLESWGALREKKISPNKWAIIPGLQPIGQAGDNPEYLFVDSSLYYVRGERPGRGVRTPNYHSKDDTSAEPSPTRGLEGIFVSTAFCRAAFDRAGPPWRWPALETGRPAKGQIRSYSKTGHLKKSS